MWVGYPVGGSGPAASLTRDLLEWSMLLGQLHLASVCVG